MTKGNYIEWTKDLADFCRWFSKTHKTEDFHLLKLVKGKYYIASPAIKGGKWGLDFMLPLSWYKNKIKQEGVRS